jgi:hypothetical protein
MLARANSDAGTRLRRSKSASTVQKRPTSIAEPLDLNAVKQQALAAATAAFARAQAQEAADRQAKRSSEIARTKSNASRKSLTSQGSHFPPRESSFRSLQPQKTEHTKSIHRLSQASTANSEQNTEQFPPFYPTPAVDRPLLAPRQLSTQTSITFTENARPSSQPKPLRQSASSSVTSQQIRKARSMYYASSVQTGSPIARPPAKYLTTPPAVSLGSATEPPPVNLSVRTLRPSPLAGPRMPVTVGPDATLDKARDEYLQGFQQKAVKHKPSMFLAPFKKRQDKGKDKENRSVSGTHSFSTTSQQTPDESTTDITVSDFLPPPEVKEKRSFSGSLRSKFKKVFRRTSAKSTNLPVQHIEASRDYSHASQFSPPLIDDAYVIPPPEEEMLQRVRARTPILENAHPAFLRSGSRSSSNGSGRSNRSLHSEANATNVSASRVTSWGTSTTSDTLTQRAIKRMTVIHESKDSIGSEADRVASMSATRRKSLPLPPLASFRDPMPMESLTEESMTPVDPKRVFSALMREMGTSKSVQASLSPNERTPGAESDVFESSTTKLHSQTRELHSSGSRNLRSSLEIDQRPPSRRPATAQSAQSKTSTIRSLGRAIRSTIRTVTPAGQHSSPDPDTATSVRGVIRSAEGDENVSSAATTPESEDSPNDVDRAEEECRTQAFTPSASQIEKRVERAKDRWKSPLEETECPQFPRETDRTYDVTNFAQHTYEVPYPSIEHNVRPRPGTPTIGERNSHRLPTSPKVSASPAPRATMTPLSPSIYSRNTDGVSILPNDSVMSFGGGSELERAHNGGSAVILTSQSVRSYVIGTPSPQRPGSTRTSRDWRAWLSHEVSSIELTSQEDLRIHEQYATPSRIHRHDSIRTSHTDHDDTTVVLRESCDITTPRPDVEPSVATDALHVAKAQDAHGPPGQLINRPGIVVQRSERPTSHIDAAEESSYSHPPISEDSGDAALRKATPLLGSAPLLSRQRAPSTPRSNASASQSVLGTPRSSQMNERFPFIDTGRHSSSNSLSSRHSRSPTDSIASAKSLKSPKSTPGPRAHSNVSAPATNETSQRIPVTALKRSDAQLKRKENVTPSSLRGKAKANASPLGVSIRPVSQQPLSSSTLNRSTPQAAQSIAKAPETDHSRQQSSPAATPLRPRIRATMRPISPEKLTRRPRSAFDLRGANGVGRPNVVALNTPSPRPGSELRRPALHVKTSSSSLAASKEPSPETVDRVIDSVLDVQRSGSITPGQRMADRFLKERKSTTALEGSAGKLRGGLKLVREDTPAFL